MKNICTQTKPSQATICANLLIFLVIILIGCSSTSPKIIPETNNNSSKHIRAVNYIVDNLDMLATSLPDVVNKVSTVNVDSFKDLKLIELEFDYYLNQFEHGNPNIGLLPFEDKNQLLAIKKLWNELKSDINSVLRAEGTVRMTSEFSSAIVETIPVLSEMFNRIVNDLRKGKATKNQTSIAAQQLALLSSISTNSKKILDSGKNIEAKIEKIGKDATTFRMALNALIKGDNTMGLSKVKSQDVQYVLSDVQEVFDSINPIFGHFQEGSVTLSSFANATSSIPSKASKLMSLIDNLKKSAADLSVAQKNSFINTNTVKDTVTLPAVYLQIEDMQTTLFKCRFSLSDIAVPLEELDKIIQNCGTKIENYLTGFLENRNDVLFAKSKKGKYLVNTLRNLYIRFKGTQNYFSKKLDIKKSHREDIENISKILPNFIEQTEILASHAIENDETTTTIYVIMRQLIVLKRLENNVDKLSNISSRKYVPSIYDRIGRDNALFKRVSDALVNSNGKMKIKAVVNSKLKKDLSALNNEFENKISSNVEKILNSAPDYLDSIQSINSITKYIDEMIVEIDYLKTLFRSKTKIDAGSI